MGIKDFENIDKSSLNEKLLLVSPDESFAARVKKLADTRDYQVFHYTSLEDANDSEDKTLYDLVIFQTGNEQKNIELSEVVTSIRSDFRRNRCPTIVASDIDNIQGIVDDNIGLQILPLNVSDVDLLFSISNKLRLHKVKSKRASIASDIAFENANLRDLTLRFKKELTQARKMQASILPKELPAHENLEFAVQFDPLEAVGGDLYDIFQISENKFGVLIADVVGHGLSASMVGMMVKMSEHYSRDVMTSPEEFLGMMNRGLEIVLSDGKFATAAYTVIDLEKKAITVSLAGHMHGLLLKGESNEVLQVGAKGFALGMIPDAKYNCEELSIDAGDRFYFYTDGISEAQNMANEMWGTEGLTEAILAAKAASTFEDSLKLIKKKQLEFTGGRLVKDDVTILGFGLVP